MYMSPIRIPARNDRLAHELGYAGSRTVDDFIEIDESRDCGECPSAFPRARCARHG